MIKIIIRGIRNFFIIFFCFFIKLYQIFISPLHRSCCRFTPTCSAYALEAIKNSAPFGEFPENSLKEFISVKYSFDTILIEEERMNGYYELAKMNAGRNPEVALNYLNLALEQVGGEEASCFLYKRRAEIKERLGDTKGAQEDYEVYNLYTKRTNIKRVHLLKHLTETKPSAYLYHYLAFAYQQINDYPNALVAIDKAISMSVDNASLRHYKEELLKAREMQN